MILKILLTLLFIMLISLLLFFVFAIFIPAVNSPTVGKDIVFSDYELNYIYRVQKDFIKATQMRAQIEDCDKNKEKDSENESPRLFYNGIKNCALFNSIYESFSQDKEKCLAFGDCVKVCPNNALEIVDNKVVVTSNCCGCGKCVLSCPKKLIKLIPKNELSLQLPQKKCFKFWQSCYKMVARR